MSGVCRPRYRMPTPNAAAETILVPPTVNLFLTSICNYRCRFCFATFPNLRTTMPETEALAIVDELARAGVRRVTFVGGEPTLLAYLPALLAHSKEAGLATCLVTNAS